MAMVLVHSVLHLYYVLTWNKTYQTKRIISWSSLEWKSEKYDIQSILLTSYDILIHLINAVLLSSFISTQAVVVCLIFIAIQLKMTLYKDDKECVWTQPTNISDNAKRALGEDMDFETFMKYDWKLSKDENKSTKSFSFYIRLKKLMTSWFLYVKN